MPRRRKTDTSVRYFSRRIRERLSNIKMAETTILEAPSGFGKTTAVMDYLKNNVGDGVRVLRHVCFEEPNRSAWRRFCQVIFEADPAAGGELLRMGLPDEAGVGEAAGYLRSVRCEEDTWIVIDDFHLLIGAVSDMVWKALLSRDESRLRLIIMTRPLGGFSDFALGKSGILYIDSGDLRLSPGEVREYFCSAGISLREHEVMDVFARTDGWIIALYLHMLHYAENGRFSHLHSVEKLVRAIIWDALCDRQRELLLILSLFDSFTVKQASWLLGGETLPEYAREIIENNAFLRYDPEAGCYYIHSTLRAFVTEIFSRLSDGERRAMILRAGDWCRNFGDTVRAMTFYYRAGDMERLLALPLEGHELAQMDMVGNSATILDIVALSTPELRSRYPMTMLRLAFELFGAGRFEEYIKLTSEMRGIIAQSSLPQDEKNRLLGEAAFLLSFAQYNDIAAMSRCHREASALIGNKSSMMLLEDTWTLGMPSVFMAYHSEAGRLDENLSLMDECLPVYLGLSGGHGSGADILFRAEAEYMRGRFQEAEILAHRARFVAEKNRQGSISICVDLLLCKLSVLRGDGGAAAVLDHMRGIVKSSVSISNEATFALAVGSLMGILERPEEMPKWVRHGDISLENIFLAAMPMAQKVFCKYLLLTDRCEVLLGMVEDAMALAERLKYHAVLIYLHIYASAAYDRRAMRDRSIQLLKKAAEMAEPDGVLMPFAENYESIRELLRDCCSPRFFAALEPLACAFSEGRRGALSAMYPDVRPFGLTEREHEAVMLAVRGFTNPEIAERMFLSRNTVKGYMKVAYQKTGVGSRSELKKVFLDP